MFERRLRTRQVCAGVAHLIRRPRLARISPLRLQIGVRSRRPIRQVVAPDDHVMALAGDNVVGAVPLLPEVHDAAADRVRVPGARGKQTWSRANSMFESFEVLIRRVRVPEGEVAVGGLAHLATEGEAGGGELAPEAHVERDVRVVRVHVEPEVLLLWPSLSWWRRLLLLWWWWVSL